MGRRGMNRGRGLARRQREQQRDVVMELQHSHWQEAITRVGTGRSESDGEPQNTRACTHTNTPT